MTSPKARRERAEALARRLFVSQDDLVMGDPGAGVLERDVIDLLLTFAAQENEQAERVITELQGDDLVDVAGLLRERDALKTAVEQASAQARVAVELLHEITCWQHGGWHNLSVAPAQCQKYPCAKMAALTFPPVEEGST
jgi:hypothetical protein